MTSKPVAKYLSSHAEPEAAVAARLPGQFGNALVVPAYGEGDSLFALLGSVASGSLGPPILILVLNARADSSAKIHRVNALARQRLASSLAAPTPLSGEPPIRMYPLEKGALVLIDRALPGAYLPKGQGVGLARKVGFDLALALRARGQLASSWIHSTDADTLLPRDYFDRVLESDSESTAAAIYPFKHDFDADPLLAEAGRLYEISLRYYVLGLAWAGSPYAYQSMGSCLAISADAYARVRGFPRRNALEDFYALNKLAKVGAIERLGGDVIRLEGRISERVPISTGKALSELVSRRTSAVFRLYHPLVFAHLAAWLKVLGAIARSKGDLKGSLSRLPHESPFFRRSLLQGELEALGALAAAREAIGRSKDEGNLLTRLHTWFDAFRTLKLVHALRNGGLSSLDYRRALAEAPFTNLMESMEGSPEELRKTLVARERKLTKPVGVSTVRL